MLDCTYLSWISDIYITPDTEVRLNPGLADTVQLDRPPRGLGLRDVAVYMNDRAE